MGQMALNYTSFLLSDWANFIKFDFVDASVPTPTLSMGHICHIKCIWHVSTNVKLFGVISSHSDEIPTDPWNIPQTLNQLSFLRKLLHICILGYLDVPRAMIQGSVGIFLDIYTIFRAVTTICSNSLQHSTGTFYTLRVGRLARYLIEQYGKCKSIRVMSVLFSRRSSIKQQKKLETQGFINV